MSRSPFPGMDPYLESPFLWQDVHNSLTNIFREQLAPLLRPKYVAELETQIVIDHVTDDWREMEQKNVLSYVSVTRPKAVMHTIAATTIAPAPLRVAAPVAVPTRLVTLRIRHRETERLVAVIELLSPVNKRAGKGREAYLDKREAYLEEKIHLIEIDLLRGWKRMPPRDQLPPCDYVVMIRNLYDRRYFDIWPIGLRDPLPILPIPLIRPDPPVPLDLGKAVRTAYERAAYDLRINYNLPPTPRLSKEDAQWAAELIAKMADE